MVRDSGPILDEFLRRLKRQKVSLPYELVVLYYGQNLDTLERLKPFSSRIIKIPPNKFNLGISRDLVCNNASGKYIVTVSVDALPTSRLWLNELISPIVSGKADIVQGGQKCPRFGDSNYPNFFFWEQNYIFFYSSEGKRFISQYGGIGLSCVNMAFRKSVWVRGGFRGVSYCEDKIFQKQAYRNGYISIFNNKALVLHAHSYPTLNSLFHRISNEGLGWKQVGEKYGIGLFLKDICRIDLHLLAIRATLNNKLKFNSEIFFFFIRPIALFWGNNFAHNTY